MKLFCDIIVKKSNSMKEFKDPFIKILLTMFFELFITNPIFFTVNSKFTFLESVMNNTHLSDSTKDQFILYFYNSQRVYWILSRFINNHKIIRKDS